MKKKPHTRDIRDIDVFDGDSTVLLGTIKNASSYNDAINRSKRELKLPLSQSEYTYSNTVNRTGKLINND